MIISDKDAVARLSSPGNLINKLKSVNGRTSAMNLFGVSSAAKSKTEQINITEAAKFINPFNDPRDAVQLVPLPAPQSNNGNKEISSPAAEMQVEDLIDNSDQQIKLANAHNTALQVMTDALSELSIRIPEMKADKLPAAIAATSKVVESIRRERREAGRAKNEGIHLHIYAPQQNPIEQYSVIEVG